MAKVYLLFFMLCAWSGSSFAQEKELSVVDYFSANEHSFKCDFAKTVLDELKDQTEAEIETRIHQEISSVEEMLLDSNEELTRSEKKMLRHQERVLNRLLNATQRKVGVQKFFENLCSHSEFALGNTAKGIAHGANVINQSITLPVRFVYRFFKGLSTGKVSRDPQVTFYDAIGKDKYRAIGFYGLYQGFKALMVSNPYTIPFLITPMADYLAMSVCETKSSLRPDEFKFCQNYESVKQRFFAVAKQGEELGAKLSKHQADDQKPKGELPAQVDDENLCDYLRIVNDDKTNSEKFVEFKKVMLLMNTPGYYSHPVTQDLSTEDSMMVRTNSSSMVSLRNVIISLAPRDSIREEITASGEYATYKKNLKKLGKLQKIFGKLYRSHTKEECVLKKQKYQFNLKEYDALKDEISNNRDPGYVFQDSLIQKQINKAEGRFQFFNKTKLHWEVISADTLNQVHQILRSPDVGNVVIVSHTEGTFGKLVDSSVAQYPTSFFSDLSPSLMSLNFYSCHADKILKTFALEEKFLQSQTIHKKRQLNFAQDSQMVDGEGSPLSGFGDFLIRVDNGLVPLMEGNMLHQSIHGQEYPSMNAKMCKVSLGNVQVSQGTMSVIVNRHFVGTVNRFETVTEFEFPCSFANRPENVILLQNHSLLESYPVSMDAEIQKLSVNVTGINVDVEKPTHFYEQAQSGYLSSKIIFKRK
jgi:hypothetical protein